MGNNAGISGNVWQYRQNALFCVARTEIVLDVSVGHDAKSGSFWVAGQRGLEKVTNLLIFPPD